MKHIFNVFIQKQLLRHKLFYLLFLGFIVLGIITTQDTWLINGWIKYCNAATINLSDFTSIFELLAAFNLAYTVILKFKGDVSNRLYSWAITSLETSRLYVDEIIVTNEIRNENNTDLAEYIEDLARIRSKEHQNLDSEANSPSVDPFLYFGLFAICCLIMSGLVNGLIGSTFFKIKAYSFLLLFSLVSIVYVELEYYFSKRSHFEITILAFFVLILICFSIIRITNFGKIKEFISTHYWIRDFFPSVKTQTAINYIVLLAIVVNIYPYFLIFRSLYFKCLQYTCTSFQIISIVKTQVGIENTAGLIGLFIENFGGEVNDRGARIGDRIKKTGNNVGKKITDVGSKMRKRKPQ